MAKKRSANGAGSIRKRPDGTWEARYTLGSDPGTGKPIRKSVYGKTQKEVRRKLTQATAAVDTGTYFEPTKLTLGQWLDTWLAEYTMDLKPHTRENYEMHVRRNLKPYLGAVPLAQLRAPMIQKLYNQMSRGEAVDPTDRQKCRPALSPKTLQNLHGTLHKALQQAVELELLSQTWRTPASGLGPRSRRFGPWTKGRWRPFWRPSGGTPLRQSTWWTSIPAYGWGRFWACAGTA